MPRDGSGVYSKPVGTTASPNTTIESSKYNAVVDDLVVDANAARPVTAGGTGETSARLPDGTWRFKNTADPTKLLALDLSGLTTATTRTLAVQDKNGTIALVGDVAAKMDTRRNLSVNGSLIDSQENGNTLGSTTGYFYADQKALYKSGTLGVSVQRVAYASLAGGQFAGEFKVTTAKGTLGATDLITDTDFVEGSDPEFVALGWGAAGAKPFMYRKEVQKPAGTYSFHVSNKANNRHCWVPYTIAPGDANVKKVVEVQIPGDTGGVWSKVGGDIGCVVDDVLVAGSTYVGGTAGVWGATAYYAGAGQKNFLDNIANVARHTDFGLRADPDATGVYGAYRVGEVDAVFQPMRYWERANFPSSNLIMSPVTSSSFVSNVGYAAYPWKVRKCKIPAMGGVIFTNGTTTANFPDIDSVRFSATVTSGTLVVNSGFYGNARLS